MDHEVDIYNCEYDGACAKQNAISFCAKLARGGNQAFSRERISETECTNRVGCKARYMVRWIDKNPSESSQIK